MAPSLTEPEFRLAADAAFEDLERSLLSLANEHDFDVERSDRDRGIEVHILIERSAAGLVSNASNAGWHCVFPAAATRATGRIAREPVGA
mgnify:CR=1 FL=1